ncbi:hypothetical protein A5625_20315 [Mycobacterium sp. 1465703.0]|nr:hypothetical protein A5625_20315 [Mycobacterium sp. 1465703.0]
MPFITCANDIGPCVGRGERATAAENGHHPPTSSHPNYCLQHDRRLDRFAVVGAPLAAGSR